MKIVSMVFLKKIFLQGKWVIWGLKMTDGQNSGSALRSFLNFGQSKTSRSV